MINNHTMQPLGCHLVRKKKVKNPKIINLAPTGLGRSSRLDDKPKNKYSSFSKFSLAVIGAYNMVKNLHMFPTGANQHIKLMNGIFDGTLYYFGPMLFA